LQIGRTYVEAGLINVKDYERIKKSNKEKKNSMNNLTHTANVLNALNSGQGLLNLNGQPHQNVPLNESPNSNPMNDSNKAVQPHVSHSTSQMGNNNIQQFNLNSFNNNAPFNNVTEINDNLLCGENMSMNGLVENPVNINQFNDDNELFDDIEENNFDKK